MSDAKVELGRRLFYDLRLSANRTASCATCHRQHLAFTDGRALARGSTGELHPRSTLTLTNAAYNATLDWADPPLTRLELQIPIPLGNTRPVELGWAGREEEMLGRLAADPTYRRLFARAFGREAARGTLGFDAVVRALASFVRTLISGGSPYDRVVFHGDHDALGPAAWRGMRLFFSERLGCSGCHGGFNLSGPVVWAGGPDAEPQFHNTGLYNLDGRGAYPPSDTGLHRLTGRRRDMGRFRAPTLRNIAVTAPYMHDGSLPTLEAVIGHYAAGGRVIRSGLESGDGRKSPLKSRRIRGFALSESETRDLVAFLESLTDEGFLSDPRFADPWPPAAEAE
jgi:cytochrome c peroxidase